MEEQGFSAEQVEAAIEALQEAATYSDAPISYRDVFASTALQHLRSCTRVPTRGRSPGS
jgi:hypothetical protein